MGKQRLWNEKDRKKEDKLHKWMRRRGSLSSKHYSAIGAGTPCPGAPSGADARLMETKAVCSLV